MADEPLVISSRSEQLLELIALELAHSRLKSKEPSYEGEKIQGLHLEQTINDMQNRLGLLPVKIQAEREGVEVLFYYSLAWGGPITPTPEVVIELESQVWRDPVLAVKVLEAKQQQKSIVVSRKLSTYGYRSGKMAWSDFSAPEYTMNPE